MVRLFCPNKETVNAFTVSKFYPKNDIYKHRWMCKFLPAMSVQQRLRKVSWHTDWRESFISETSWAWTLSLRATCWLFIYSGSSPAHSELGFPNQEIPLGTLSLWSISTQESGCREGSGTPFLQVGQRSPDIPKDTVINEFPCLLPCTEFIEKKEKTAVL